MPAARFEGAIRALQVQALWDQSEDGGQVARAQFCGRSADRSERTEIHGSFVGSGNIISIEREPYRPCNWRL